ncbi:unnamed protein product, partial [Rotaria sp. Silwood1]
FSCGDGQCVEDFQACHNGRHILLAESMSAQGNLSQNCWMVMVRLTKIIDHVVGMSCKQYFESSYSNAHLYSCESFTQFPIIPILQGHHNIHCENGGECIQDDPMCPSYTTCNCNACFFGD